MGGKARRGVAAKAATRGRPTKYRAEFAEQGRRLALLGLTDEAMAAFFGVTEQTLNNWKRAHTDFFESIQAGKDAADAAVALALYRSAIGDGMVAETKTVTDGDGRVTRTEETRQIPASVQAQSLWLRNRQPQLWRDRVAAECIQTLNDRLVEKRRAETGRHLPSASAASNETPRRSSSGRVRSARAVRKSKVNVSNRMLFSPSDEIVDCL